MTQKEIEVILTRQLASYLAIPIFIVDPAGTLVYFNEPAEGIIGRRFEETGELTLSEWSDMAQTSNVEGTLLAEEKRPLLIALMERRPVHSTVRIRGANGSPRYLEVTSLPLIGMAGRFLGAAALFWETSP